MVDVGDGRGTEPTPAVRPETSATDRGAGAVLPGGLVGGSLAFVLAVRRAMRRD